ncbi:MAG: hypothetical protein ABI895_17685 [Deltaproteobacteria bacterium]
MTDSIFRRLEDDESATPATARGHILTPASSRFDPSPDSASARDGTDSRRHASDELR